MSDYVYCRAALAGVCEGEPSPYEPEARFLPTVEVVYEGLDGGETVDHREDGTYLEVEGVGSIVCMSCFCALMSLTPSGKALTDEIPAAIEAARKMRPEEFLSSSAQMETILDSFRSN
jgi:hypothetical protein